jgi:hypothetical protein
MAARVRATTLWDLCLLMDGGAAHTVEEHACRFGIDVAGLRTCSTLDLVVDWYCLRQSPAQAPGYISTQKLDCYRFLAQTYGDVHAPGSHEPKGFFAVFLGILGRSLERASRETRSL